MTTFYFLVKTEQLAFRILNEILFLFSHIVLNPTIGRIKHACLTSLFEGNQTHTNWNDFKIIDKSHEPIANERLANKLLCHEKLLL